MGYLSIRRSDLIAKWDNRYELDFRSYQCIGQFLKSEGYNVGKLNADSLTLKANVVKAWIQFYGDTGKLSPVENVTESSAVAVAVAPVKPVKRDYPITVSDSLGGYSENHSSQFKGRVIDAINSFFSLDHFPAYTLTLHWSQAR